MKKDIKLYTRKRRGAVAAPTAGLHFDDCMLKELKENKIDSSHITLHVGAGTFQSLRQEDVNKNSLHSEFAKLDKQVCLAIENAKSQNGRVIPVGTTSMRTIETASSNIGIKPWCGETNIFIKPGYNFKYSGWFVNKLSSSKIITFNVSSCHGWKRINI